jgi:hypothetical protein
MKRLRAFLGRLPGGHRPPTGPLTTAEESHAEAVRQETLMEDNERIEREQEERAERPDREG